jgi:hypothetical protein
MRKRSGTSRLAILVAVVLLAIVVGSIALVLLSGGEKLSDRWKYETNLKTDPALVKYTQVREIKSGFGVLRGIAIAGDKLYLVGDKAVRMTELDGTFIEKADLSGEPRCVAVSPAGVVYVGIKNHVEIAAINGQKSAAWPAVADKALVTSLAVADEAVYVADAVGRKVHKFDVQGGRLADVGDGNFVVPSPYFDLALGADGLLRVIDPGRHQVRTYETGGAIKSQWGEFGTEIRQFPGCCNPVHLAMLADGRCVTSEKGARVKIYSPGGEFECIVAGPDVFNTMALSSVAEDDYRKGGFDLAADGQGLIYVVDPGAMVVRVFQKKQ